VDSLKVQEGRIKYFGEVETKKRGIEVPGLYDFERRRRFAL
jgi:hypothetical protein